MLRFTNVDQKPTRLPPVYGYRTHPLLPLRQALDPILSRIDKLDQFIQIAKNECHFPSEHDLTREESASIYIYTMEWGEKSLYRVLNDALRKSDRSVLVPWHGYLKLFDTALQKLPSLQMNLWRGINLDISQNFREGEEITWWKFDSCASSVKVVKEFLGPVSTLLMIEAKNGKSISAYSSYPQEHEVILGLGTRVRVVSDALDHPSLNIVHLVELLGNNNEELSSSVESMNISQAVKTAASKYLFPTQLLTDDCIFIFCQDTWVNNKYSTFRLHTYTDGSRYEGEWKNKTKHGKGTYCYADGSKYTGSWVDDKKEGEGDFTWTNGERYEMKYSQMSCNHLL